MGNDPEATLRIAARYWWRSKRPVGWSQRKHLDMPAIGSQDRGDGGGVGDEHRGSVLAGLLVSRVHRMEVT